MKSTQLELPNIDKLIAEANVGVKPAVRPSARSCRPAEKVMLRFFPATQLEFQTLPF